MIKVYTCTYVSVCKWTHQVQQYSANIKQTTTKQHQKHQINNNININTIIRLYIDILNNTNIAIIIM